MAAEGKKRNLGRGLSALLGEDEAVETSAAGPRDIRRVPIEFLTPGRFQPRQKVDDEPLRELAQSIADKGILQPLLVRQDPDNADTFEIIAGERRWRAAQLAKLYEVPVIIKNLEDREALEIALIENLQREDLSALDEAQGYQRLKNEFSYTQAELASSLGKSRSHVANTLRLLKLPEPVKGMIGERALSAGHARALLNAQDPTVLARDVVRRGLNVRQTEKLVKKESRPAKARSEPAKDADTVALERDLANLLGLKVGIAFRGDAGSMTIHYQSLEQLDDILYRLSQGALGASKVRLEGVDDGEPWPLENENAGADDLSTGLSDFLTAAEKIESEVDALEPASEEEVSLSFADTSAAIADILADHDSEEENHFEAVTSSFAETSDAVDGILADTGSEEERLSIESTEDLTDSPGTANDILLEPNFGEETYFDDGAESLADTPDSVSELSTDGGDDDDGQASPAENSSVESGASANTDDDDFEGVNIDEDLSEADAAALIAGIAEGLGFEDIPTNGVPTGDLRIDEILIEEEDDPFIPKDPSEKK